MKSAVLSAAALAALTLAPAAYADSVQSPLPATTPAFGVNFEPEQPLSPVSQQNAVRTAEDYLDVSAFSRQGLIDQLEYSGFSTADATFAVDHITVDWNEQAAKAAKDYLDISGFSRSGLIDQLEYSGFTPTQALYGVAAVGF